MSNQAYAKCIDMAIGLYHSNPNKNKHWTFFVHRGRIISVGMNRDKTHPLVKKHWKEHSLVHSELDCMNRYNGKIDASKIEVVNIRLNPHKELRNSKPCECCSAWLQGQGFRKFSYTTESGWVHEVL